MDGNVNFTTGNIDQAFSLDGIDDSIIITDDPTLDGMTELTLAAWIRTTQSGGNPAVIAKYSACTPAGGDSYYLTVRGSGDIDFQICQTDDCFDVGTYLNAPASVDDGNWHFVAGTFANGVMNIYVDGTLIKSASTSITSIANSSSPLRIGAYSSDACAVAQYFNGSIDDAQIFNRALSPAEIQDIYNAGSSGQCVPNQPPTANADGPYDVNEGALIFLDGGGSNDPDGDSLSFEWDLDDDAVFETSGTTPPFDASVLDGPSVRAIALRVCDPPGECDTDSTSVSVANVVPAVGPINAPLDPVQVNLQIGASADFTDPGVLDSHTAIWDWGDNTTSTGTVTETGGSGTVSGSHAYQQPGVYTIVLTVTDKDGDSGEAIYQFVVVYDPNGGFVTGGGWINSPTGAYSADPSLAGKANFGFVSKYLQGANTPSGETEFNFKVADLNSIHRPSRLKCEDPAIRPT